MRRFLSVTAVIVCVSLFAAIASGATITFSATLTPEQEIPAPVLNGTTPSGMATATLDTVARTVQFMLDWQGLTSMAIGAHIHRINPMAATPGTGPITVNFLMFTDPPMQPADSLSGTVSIDNATVANLIAGLGAGDMYFNVHTENNRPGEIRGNIAAVPEPGAIGLLGGGLVALLTLKRRRR